MSRKTCSRTLVTAFGLSAKEGGPFRFDGRFVQHVSGGLQVDVEKTVGVLKMESYSSQVFSHFLQHDILRLRCSKFCLFLVGFLPVLEVVLSVSAAGRHRQNSISSTTAKSRTVETCRGDRESFLSSLPIFWNMRNEKLRER